MNELTSYQAAMQTLVEEYEGRLTTTSIKVAEHFGKNHRDVMRTIRNIAPAAEVNTRKIARIEPAELEKQVKISEFFASNFTLSSYVDDRGREQEMYIMTEEGFSFIAMGFTGPESSVFKIDFLNEFRVRTLRIRELEVENTALLQAIIHDQKHILDAIKGKDKGYVVDVVRLMERDQGRAAVVRAHETKVEIHEQFVNRAKSLVAQGVKNKELTESLQNLIRWHEKVWDDLFVKDGKFASSRFFHDVTY